MEYSGDELGVSAHRERMRKEPADARDECEHYIMVRYLFKEKKMSEEEIKAALSLKRESCGNFGSCWTEVHLMWMDEIISTIIIEEDLDD